MGMSEEWKAMPSACPRAVRQILAMDFLVRNYGYIGILLSSMHMSCHEEWKRKEGRSIR